MSANSCSLNLSRKGFTKEFGRGRFPSLYAVSILAVVVDLHLNFLLITYNLLSSRPTPELTAKNLELTI